MSGCRRLDPMLARRRWSSGDRRQSSFRWASNSRDECFVFTTMRPLRTSVSVPMRCRKSTQIDSALEKRGENTRNLFPQVAVLFDSFILFLRPNMERSEKQFRDERCCCHEALRSVMSSKFAQLHITDHVFFRPSRVIHISRNAKKKESISRRHQERAKAFQQIAAEALQLN